MKLYNVASCVRRAVRLGHVDGALGIGEPDWTGSLSELGPERKLHNGRLRTDDLQLKFGRLLGRIESLLSITSVGLADVIMMS